MNREDLIQSIAESESDIERCERAIRICNYVIWACYFWFASVVAILGLLMVWIIVKSQGGGTWLR